ncbi:MAG: molybdopterin-dependent oxidoreductase, partial [Acidobacteria bacterium]|nr:molybdopterin-dependent oxidoreductase [Acidobacteriota bacterium]
MRFIRRTRREFLSAALRGGAATIAASSVPGWPAWRRGESDRYGALAQAGATQLGMVPFDVEWSQVFDEPISQGLGGRVIHKLSTLTPDTLITPNEHFFVRTAKPALLGSTENWQIAVGGLVDEPTNLALVPLLSLAESQGVHLLECSGNPRRRSFGLMSACEWGGMSAVGVFELTRPLSRATRVLIGGFDEHSGRGGGIP